MPTLLRPNGKPGHMEVVWPPLIKWGSGVVATLLCAGVLNVIVLYAKVSALDVKVDTLVDSLKEKSVNADKRHDDFETRLRVLEHTAQSAGVR